MSRSLLLMMLLAVAVTGTAPAQDALAWRDSLTRLRPQVAALRDSLVLRDSTVVEVERGNGVILSSTPSDKTNASRAFQSFLEQRNRWFGSAAPSPNGFRLVVQILPARDVFAQFARRREGARVILSGLPDTLDAVRAERAAEPADLANQMMTGFSEMMFPTLGVPTTRWLDSPLPFHMTDRDRRALVMYAMMTSTGKAGRGCIDGPLDLCMYALGLRTASSSDLTDEYSPLVRADLFLSALEIGGPTAWARVMDAHPARAEDALVAASGLPADSLVARWRSGIISLRPDTGPLGAATAFLVAGWAGVLLLGTLGATRWR